MKAIHIYIGIVLLVLMAARATAQSEHYTTVTLSIDSLIPMDLEEDDRNSEKLDQLCLFYTLHTYKKRGTLASVNNGFYRGATTIDSVLAGFKPISADVPHKGRVTVAFALIEIDYENRVNAVLDSLDPLAFRQTASNNGYYDEGARAWLMIENGYTRAGLKVDLQYLTTSVLFGDDLLGEEIEFFNKRQTRKLRGQTLIVETHIEGSNLYDPYHYLLKYRVKFE